MSTIYIRLKHVNTPPVGTIEVIEMEKYLEGVVYAELGGTTQIEALKAQAVAARTYAARYLHSDRNYDLDDTTNYQAYKTGAPPHVKLAVAATSGIVVTYGSKLATTVYSSSNGGRIRSSEEVWGSKYSYLVSKSDPYTQRSGYKKYGHGVGMSQRGAIQAASEGLSYTQILSFYYPGTSLKSNYNGTSSSTVTPTSTKPVVNKGNLIITEAKKHIGKPYVWGAAGPSSFDCSGFIYYVYKQAINYNWSRTTAYQQYKLGNTVSDFRAGDLIFFVNTYTTGNSPNISHVAIATGNGDEFIHAGSGNGVEIVPSLSASSYYNSHYYTTKRLLSDSETSGVGGINSSEVVSMSPTEVKDILTGMAYSEESDRYLQRETGVRNLINSTAASLASAGLSGKIGYLVDLTNGGDEFKFILPEYDIDTQANWDSMNILGRSVEIRGYNSTSARSITISLELIAGEGLYTSKGDRVLRMHKDIAFVQSLEYPDYSKALVFPPPVVYLQLSEVTNLKGIVTNVSVKYKKPYDTLNRPMMATLSFTVVQISDNPPDYSDIRDVSYLRGDQ